MTNLTLSGWKQSIAAGLVEIVPLQTFESSLVLADDYLATTGGWVPDDAGDPTGPGVPASGATNAQAMQDIRDEQLERIYSADLSGVLSFTTHYQINLAPGLSDADVLAAMEARFEDFVEAQLPSTNLAFVNLDSFTGSVVEGPTTQTEREAIQTSILSGGKITNPKEIALVAARARFSLDNTYNVQYMYTQPGKVLFHLMVQYTDATYATEDTNATNQYVIKLDPVTYEVTSGLIVVL